jgi:cysteine desulfurase/selenocysteine lyase
VDALVAALKELTAGESARQSAPNRPVAHGKVHFPNPFGESPEAAAKDLIELFDFLPDWGARMHEVVEMGENLPPMPDELKTEGNRVHGCQSTVHLVGVRRGNRLDFLADSDAALVRGLIGILQRVYTGQTAEDVLAFDIETFLRRIGLEAHLSMGRRNGLEGMIKKIRELANGIVSQP